MSDKQQLNAMLAWSEESLEIQAALADLINARKAFPGNPEYENLLQRNDKLNQQSFELAESCHL